MNAEKTPHRFEAPHAGRSHTRPGVGGHRIEVIPNTRPLGSYTVDAVLCVKANGPVPSVSALARLVWIARTGGVQKKPAGWQTQSSRRLFFDVDALAHWMNTPKGEDPADHIPPLFAEKLFYRYADGSIGLSDYGEAVAETLASARDLSRWEVEQ